MIIVDTISAVLPPMSASSVAGVLVVRMTSGEEVTLDVSDPRDSGWLSILEELRASDDPVYLDIDSNTHRINTLLIPDVYRVVGIDVALGGDQHEVELEISQARHHIRVSSPDYQRILQTLRFAKDSGDAVLITESVSGNEIIDARLIREGKLSPLLEAPRSGGVALVRASELFNVASEEACPSRPVSSILPPCVPFFYPEDGCWARAHAMCRSLLPVLDPAEVPFLRKIWIYGRLRVRTNNSPACAVYWGWHVAPTLAVDVGKQSMDLYVLDPSLFSEPVPVALWKEVQGDRHASLFETLSSVYYRSPRGEISEDADYKQTDQKLRKYRLKFKNRVISRGSPPYQCG